MIQENNKNIPKMNLEQFEIWEEDMKYIFELVERNENRIDEILYGNVFYKFFYLREFDKLIKENEKLLDFSESKFKEL